MTGMLVPHCPHVNTAMTHRQRVAILISLTTNKPVPVSFCNNCTAFILLFFVLWSFLSFPSVSLCFQLSESDGWGSLWLHQVLISVWWLFSWTEYNGRGGGYWMCREGKHLSHLPPTYQHPVIITNAAHRTHTLAQRIPQIPLLNVSETVCICVSVCVYLSVSRV